MSEPRQPAPPPTEGPPATRRGGCLLGLLSLLLSLAAAEGVLRLLHPVPDPLLSQKVALAGAGSSAPYVPSAYPPHVRNRVQAEPGLPGIDTTLRRFTTNNLGYRGDSLAIPRPPGEVRVFMIGGSTTECVFLDDRETVTARLQAYLRDALPGVNVRVYGAGRSGDRSWDHVAMAAHRIAHLQPDVVVVFAGVNDVAAAVAGRDYLLRPPLQPRPLGLRQLLELSATELQLGRLAWNAAHRQRPLSELIRSDYRGNARRTATLRERPIPRVDPTPYGENLRTLAGISRASGARLVLMTQATSWTAPDPGGWHWMRGDWKRGVRYPEAGLDSLMGVYNQVMRQAGAAQGVPVFDLAARLPRGTRYLYDDVHFNVRGADTTALLLARFMVEQGVITPRAPAVPPSPPAAPAAMPLPVRPRGR